MNSINRKMPYNIYSIEDLDQWRREFFYPVSLGKSGLVNDTACRALVEEYGRVGEDLKVNFRIASKAIYIETYNLLLRLLVAFGMKERRDCEFVLTNHHLPSDVVLGERNFTYELYKGGVDLPFHDLRLEYDDRYYRSIPRWKRTVKRANWFFKMRHIVQGDDALVIGPNQCTLKYVSLYEKTAQLLYPEFIFSMPARYPESREKSAAFRRLTAVLAERVDGLFHEMVGGGIPEKILADYREAVYRLVQRTVYDLAQARRFCSRLRKEARMYTGTAKYFVRVLSEAIRERGGKVTGFPHEGGLSGLHMPYLSFSEFATCDGFACFGEKEAEDYRKYPVINEVTFPVFPDLGESILDISSAKFRKNSKIDLKKISTIMYLNYSYWYDNYAYGTRSDTVGLDLQLRVIELLLSTGKKIVFKLRPKTSYISKAYRHFGYFGDNVKYTATPFSELLGSADVFVLEGVGSTALYEAMTLTDKPIVLLRTEIPRCTPELESMLQKRCYVIDLYEDDRNRLLFDPTSFRGIFEQ